MNEFIDLLRSGDMRSDGNADQVADIVIKDPARLPALLACLDDPDNVIRAHAAHAVERISKVKANLLVGEVKRLIPRGETDAYPVVRWHIAMTLGNLAAELKDASLTTESLFKLLRDTSPFVRSWAIYSLALTGRAHMEQNARILTVLREHDKDHSPAVRSRLNRAITMLQFPDLPLPDTWLKT